MRTFDAAIVGAGHNGLVCAAALARAGLSVIVLEERGVVGGACRTERVFQCAPDLGCSTGAYLLGPMPPEVLDGAGLRGRVQILPRRPHGYFWLHDGAPAAFGVEGGLENVCPDDRRGLEMLDRAVCTIRDDLAPLWLREACTLEESALSVRSGAGAHMVDAREAYTALAIGHGGEAWSVREFVEWFAMGSEALNAVVATDGLVGSGRGAHESGTGMNFLAHAMLRLPPGDSGWYAPAIEQSRVGEPGGLSRPSLPAPLGAWQLVRGGMGSITRALADVVRERGGMVLPNTRVERVRIENGAAVGLDVPGGEPVLAGTVILATDPSRAATLAGGARTLGPIVEDRLKGIADRDRAGTSLKVNMALRPSKARADGLPVVRDEAMLAGALGGRSALTGTVHVLPERATFERLERARHSVVVDGRAPDPDDCMIDVYTHTAVDPSLRDSAGRHAMSLFVQWVPPNMTAAAGEQFARALINGPVARAIPELPQLVEEVMVLTPRRIEERFGITGGHIHHVDNALAFDRRLPCRTGVRGLYLAGAGCHPAGSVIGAAGWIAAEQVQHQFT